MQSRTLFKEKKITVLGLGLLGKGLGDTVFFARAGAQITVTDLKNKEELTPSLTQLKKYKNIRYVLGRHEMSDFENCDFVVKAQGVPLNSPFIAHAIKNNIPVRMDDELFLELAPKDITVIGVTGTRGKTTTATLIYEILKKAGKRVYLAGNIRGVATLSLLPKIKRGDFVVLELSSWQLQGFHARKISPHIAVFTNFMDDHLNYYPSRKEYLYDKTAIHTYQTNKDFLITNKILGKKFKNTQAKKIITNIKNIPSAWKPYLIGDHNRENIAYAISVARLLKIQEAKIKKAVEAFKGVTGRLQFVKKVRGISIYNDNSSSTPESTITALKALNGAKNTILIAGGADKGLDMKPLTHAIQQHCKAVVLIPGSGTDKLKKITNYKLQITKGILQALSESLKIAQKGDVILFSPAFASFGQFVNVYDRGDQFMKAVKKLK